MLSTENYEHKKKRLIFFLIEFPFKVQHRLTFWGLFFLSIQRGVRDRNRVVSYALTSKSPLLANWPNVTTGRRLVSIVL